MTADPNKIELTKQINRQDILFCLARLPQSSRVFVGSSDFHVYDLDVLADKPEPKAMTGHQSYVTGAALVGSLLVTGAYDGRLIWWSVPSGEQIRAIDAHQRWIRNVAASPDGKLVVSVADDMVARVWSAEDGSLRHELRGHAERTPHHFPSMLYACAVSPDSRLAATADRLGHVIVWDLKTGKQMASVDAPEMYTWDSKQRIHSIGGARSVAFSADGKLLAVGGMGEVGNIDHLGGLARVEVFAWEKGERTHEFKGDTYKGLVECLAFHPQGAWLLAAGGDHSGFIKFLDLEGSKITFQDKAPMHVHGLALDESSRTIYAAGHGKLAVWQMPE